MLAYTRIYHKGNTDKNISSVSNELTPILGTRFLVNKWWNVGKKLLPAYFWNTDRKEEEKENTKATAKLFALDTNIKKKTRKAFCVKRKHKNGSNNAVRNSFSKHCRNTENSSNYIIYTNVEKDTQNLETNQLLVHYRHGKKKL